MVQDLFLTYMIFSFLKLLIRDVLDYYKDGDYVVLVGQPCELIGKISSLELINFISESH